MKRVIMSMLLTMAVSGFAFAQAPQAEPVEAVATEQKTEHKERTEKFKEIMEIRLQIIKSELELTDENFEKFVPIYRQYCHNLNFNRKKSPKIDFATASQKEINQHIKTRLDNEIAAAMVRKTYILIFESALTPQQVSKLYAIERKLWKRAHEEYKKKSAEK